MMPPGARQAGQKGRFARLGAGCLLAAAALLCLTPLVLRAAGAYLIVSDTLKNADAVVVLGGGDLQRTRQAVNLVLEGYGKVLIITEPGQVKEGQGLGSQVVKSEAVTDGLSPFAFVIAPDIARSTYDESVSVRRLMEEKGYQSVVVVTDPYHTNRARIIFRDTFKGSGLTARIYPVQNHWYRSTTWFFSADGWGATIREYVKLAGYWGGIHDE